MARSITSPKVKKPKKYVVFETKMVRVVWCDGSIEWVTPAQFKKMSKRAMLAFSVHRKHCHRIRFKIVVHNPR